MKRSLRDYLLTLVIAVVVFTIAAFFLIRFAESLMGDVVKMVETPQGETQTSEEAASPTAETPPVATSPEQQKDNIITFLVLGLDNGKKHADAIFLVGINSTRNTMTVSLIPSDTFTTIDNTKQKIGDLYSTRSVSYIQNFVQTETGIMPDYYIGLPMDALSNLIDFLGGITFNVPQNMYYFDPTQNLRINLKAGSQTLSGDQALQLLAFRGYSSGIRAREDTQLTFAKAFCSAFLKKANIARAKEIMYNVYHGIDSDFSSSDFLSQMDVIFNYDAYSVNFSRIPGATGSDGFYGISASKAHTLFQTYKK